MTAAVNRELKCLQSVEKNRKASNTIYLLASNLIKHVKYVSFIV
jgi:hypothetical protein